MIDFGSLKKGPDGLVPAVIQDSETLQVLMVGYMSAEALEVTYASQHVTFYSRSRNTLWTKGETSGNTLKLVSIEPDCDRDALLVKARPAGPTCHEGTVSCFGERGATGVGFLAALDRLIDSRRDGDAETSYTARLLQGARLKAAQKVGEEGVETALAAVAESDEAFLNEASDLLYHLLVLARHKDLSLSQILYVLEHRHR